MSRRRRGQNLVLMALTMLLLTLMVLGTLGIAQRVRENHELQTAADAAAYSSAVQNARGFNNIAILNRLQVSLWVAQAADESLMSWSSYARASINAAMNLLLDARTAGANYDAPRPARPCLGMRRDASEAIKMLNTVRTSMASQWVNLDVQAGREAKDIQSAISGLRAETRSLSTKDCFGPRDGVCSVLFDERDTQQVAKRVVQDGNLDGVVVHTGGRSSSMREVDCSTASIFVGGVRPGLCNDSDWSTNMLQAAMGSRGNSFVTARGVVPPRVAQALASVAAAYPEFSFSNPTPTGAGYWSSSGTYDHAASPAGVYAYGDDHGTINLATSATGACPGFGGFTSPIVSWVKSTDLIDGADQHVWGPAYRGIGQADTTDPTQVHTMGDCTPLCPSVWVRAVGFKPANGDPVDAYGQPKVTVLLERDTSVLSRPWELNFRMRFAATGPMQRFDNRGHELHGAFAGLDIRKQYAYATGITYYHRKSHWEETPNLLNPFWRATLVASDVDRQGQPTQSPDDVEDALPGNWRKAAYRELVDNGFRGFH